MDRYIKNPILGPGARIGHNASAPPFVFWDDFVGVSAMAIAANDNTIWDVDVDEGEGTVAALDEHGGWMRIKCASTTNNDFSVCTGGEAFTFQTGRSFYMETRVKFEDNAPGVAIGFFARGTILTDALATADMAIDFLGFHKPETADVFACATDQTNDSFTDTGIDTTVATAYVLGVEYSGDKDTLRYYVDGVEKVVVTEAGASGYLPNQNCAWGVITTSAGTDACEIDLDYVYIEMDRS